MHTHRIRLRIDRLKAHMRENRLSQNHWAIKLGLSRGHWSDIVNGNHPYPSAKTRDRLIEVFGLSFAELFEVEDGRPDDETAFKAAIGDRYLIDREIGHGGMGVVHLARDVRHGRLVAVKMVSAEAVAGIGAKKFLKEIRTTAQLQHHNILPLYDSGVAAGLPFYVMPYIRGGSLRELLRQRGRLTIGEALGLAEGIADGLSEAHQSRVLHCDIKPENVLLSGRHAFVADFGIARAIHAEVLEWGTREGIDSSAGTPAYVSPEQASGERNLDERSDVYSLACMMFELLAGRPPFRGTSTMEIVAQRFTTEVPDVRTYAHEVPFGVANVIQRAMSLASERRPESVAGFVTGLKKARSGAVSPMLAAGRLGLALERGVRVARRGLGPRLGGVFLESVFTDLQLAMRSLRHRLAFAVTAAVTIALGIGASTAMFSVVNAVLLRPLEYPDPERLVSIYPSNPDDLDDLALGFHRGPFSWPEFFAVREQQTSFTGVAAYRSMSGTLAGDGPPERLRIHETNFELFQILQVSPALGRLFTADDDPTAEPVALLAAGFWRNRFGADSAIVGRSIQIDDRALRVVGVLPDGFRVGTRRSELWIPMVGSSSDRGWGVHNITGAIARLAPGVSIEQAQDEMAGIIRASAPPDHGTHGALVYARLADETRSFRTPLVALIAGAFLLLAVACGNVAAILLGAGIDREHELAVRVALGASPRRIARQLLTESVLLSLVGGSGGVVAATLGMQMLLRLAPEGIPRVDTAGIDGTVLLFSVLVATAAGLAFGLVPAAVLSGTEPARVVNVSRGTTRRRARMHTAVVVAELALATVLMVSGALLTRSLFALNRVDPGFEREGLLAVTLAIPMQRYSDDPEGLTAVDSDFQRIVDEIRALPAVREVGVTSNTPLSPSRGNNKVLPEGWPPGPDAGLLAEFRFVSVDYLTTMRIPILEGRGFDERDDRVSSPHTTIISEGLARRAWPGESAIGKRIGMNAEMHVVVGVIGTLRDERLDVPTELAYYVPMRQAFGAQVGDLVIRTSGNPVQSIPAIRDRVSSLYDDLPITRMAPLVDLMSDSVGPERYRARLMAVFAVFAAVFATLGIYGVVARAVAQRARETAIRIALGAEHWVVLRTVLRRGLGIGAVGGVVGILLSMFAARYLDELLYEVSVFDPVMIAGIGAVVGIASVFASLPPALRAARTDPMVVMRAE